MRGSLLAAVFMPRLQNDEAMRLDEAPNHVQLMGAEAVVARKTKRIEPELAGLVLALHVNVRRLIAIEAREEEPVRARDSLDSWHSIAPPPFASIFCSLARPPGRLAVPSAGS